MVANGGSTVFFLAYVASVSVWFWKKRKTKEWDFRFGQREKWNENQKKKKGGGGGGEGTFPPHLLPALFLAPFFARSLTLVLRSLFRNRTEKLATQAICH